MSRRGLRIVFPLLLGFSTLVWLLHIATATAVAGEAYRYGILEVDVLLQEDLYVESSFFVDLINTGGVTITQHSVIVPTTEELTATATLTSGASLSVTTTPVTTETTQVTIDFGPHEIPPGDFLYFIVDIEAGPVVLAEEQFRTYSMTLEPLALVEYLRVTVVLPDEHHEWVSVEPPPNFLEPTYALWFGDFVPPGFVLDATMVYTAPLVLDKHIYLPFTIRH